MTDRELNMLVSCFERVFPGIDRDAIQAATPETVQGWDSMAQVTLLSLLGEESGLDIDFEEFEGANSFESILTLVRRKSRGE